MKKKFTFKKFAFQALSATAIFLSTQSVQAQENKPINESGVFSPDAQSAVISAEEVETMKIQPDVITIGHTNDIHGRLEYQPGKSVGMSMTAQFFDDMGVDMRLDSGDTYQGLPISNEDEGLSMNKAAEAAGYDAIAVGNHEFDFGLETLKKYGGQNMPLLSTNTFYTDPDTGEKTQMFQGSKVMTTQEGYTIPLIGVTTPETYFKTHPNSLKSADGSKQVVDFYDPVTYVKKEMDKYVNENKKAGVTVQKNDNLADAFVVLSHLGIDPATVETEHGFNLAKALDDEVNYDDYQIILLDGHSHTAAPAQSFGNVLYQQTGTGLENIGVVLFNPNKPGEAVGRLYDVKEVEQYTNGQQNQAVEAIVQEAAQAFNEKNSAVVVDNNPVWLNGVREYNRSSETNMGNYITDAMMEYAVDGFEVSTDFAMINGGGIRDQIAKDQPITRGDVIAVLPFGNIISQIEVTGEQVYDMFEHSLRAPVAKEDYSSSDGRYTVTAVNEKTGLPNLSTNGGFLQVSDEVKVYFDPTAESKKRVLAVYINDKLVNNTPDEKYYMATNDFLAQGGDGYDMLSGRRLEGVSLDEVVMDVMSKGTLKLTDYADPHPNNRIFAIDTKALTATDAALAKDILTVAKDNVAAMGSGVVASLEKIVTDAVGPTSQPSTTIVAGSGSGAGTSSSQSKSLTDSLIPSVSAASQTDAAKGQDPADKASTSQKQASKTESKQDNTKASKPAKSSDKQLPETGEATSLVSLAIVMLTSGSTLVLKRKKEEVK